MQAESKVSIGSRVVPQNVRTQDAGILDLDTWARFMLLVMAGLLISGCLPQVRIKPTDPLNSKKRQVVNVAIDAAKPSQATLQTLRLHGLDQRWAKDRRVVLAILNQLYKSHGKPETLASLAELSLLEARRVMESQPRLATGLCLIAASRAYLYMFDGRRLTLGRAFDRRFQQLRDVYNLSLSLYLELHRTQGIKLASQQQETPFGLMNVRVETRPGTVDPDRYEELLPTLDLKVKGPRNHYYRDGLGTTLVAYRDNPGRTPLEDFYPPEGIVRPLTAVLEYEPSTTREEDGTVRLSFYAPQLIERVSMNGQAVPLAADFTTPYGFLLSQANLKQLGFKGLVNAEKALFHLGLFMLEPYDPDQIPIVMVHGLGSSPFAWMDLTNDLNGDPQLRSRYQIWHFMYPTSLPYLFTGNLLRTALTDIRQSLDPEGEHAAMRSMVFIGHSMGGLLTKTLVSNSEDKIWNRMFKSPVENLNLGDIDQRLIQNSMIFEAQPFIDRVIFISTPHRGSKLASSTLGKLGSSLVRLPKAFLGLFDRVVRGNLDHVRDDVVRQVNRGEPTSIRALSPEDPILIALADLPIDPEVPYHSIIGDRGKEGDLWESTDGVVPYQSSHLPNADSEFVVPSGHNAYGHPFAIAEIKRILKLHLDHLKPLPTSGSDLESMEIEAEPFDSP